MAETGLLSVVALLVDLPERGLVRGQVGTVVEMLAPGVFEVEFSDDDGRTYASLALRADQLMQLRVAVQDSAPQAHGVLQSPLKPRYQPLVSSSPQDLKQHLMATNEEFRKLADQHHSYGEHLQQLAGKTFLNEQEKVEEVRLKKLRLRLKDEMERIIQQYKTQHARVI